MSARPGRRGLERIRESMSERDFAIVSSVGQHRFLSARHIEVLHFEGHASKLTAARICRRVLARLTRADVLVRLERRIGGVRAGSASCVYAPGWIGWRLLGETRRRSREPSASFLYHALAIADIHVALVQAERLGRIELIQIETEPNCWRRYTGPGGAAETLCPDLYVVTASGDYEHCWSVEVDLATESLSTVIRKCRQHAAYRQTGIEQHRTGTFPIVVWSVPSPRRRKHLAGAIASAKRLPQELFRVVEASELVGLLAGGFA
ncbi:MAG: replication-relaxation family protein [Gaiellaceae bacterium]